MGVIQETKVTNVSSSRGSFCFAKHNFNAASVRLKADVIKTIIIMIEIKQRSICRVAMLYIATIALLQL